MKNGLIVIGLLTIVATGAVDLHLTLEVYRTGLLDEANPVMRMVLEHGGERGLITIKVALTLAGCAMLGLIAKYARGCFRMPLFLALLAVPVIMYGGLMFWWAVWLHYI